MFIFFCLLFIPIFWGDIVDSPCGSFGDLDSNTCSKDLLKLSTVSAKSLIPYGFFFLTIDKNIVFNALLLRAIGPDILVNRFTYSSMSFTNTSKSRTPLNNIEDSGTSLSLFFTSYNPAPSETNLVASPCSKEDGGELTIIS